jgi:two-component system alkaline phosphatase synthesis response regulator PhoP
MSRKRILLIDDEADIREVAMLALETGGDYEVFEADGGRHGIQLASELRPDLILLDVMMPELDGPSTLAALQLRDDSRQIPVVFLTAKVQAAERRDLAALGARGIIAKPFDPMLLADEVAELVSW